MQRFHLNLHRGETLAAADEEGAEFASVEDAFLETFRAVQELWPELLRNRRDPRQYAYRIVDQRGVLLMEVPFVEILESCLPVRPAFAYGARKPEHAVLNRDFRRAMDTAHKLNVQSADLAAGLRAAWDAIKQLKDLTRANGLPSSG